MNEELKKLRESIASVEAKLKLKQIKADGGQPCDDGDEEKEMMKQMMHDMARYMYAMEDDMRKMYDNHKMGHLPPVKGPGMMKKILKALGMDEDYEVQKPVITVASTSRGMVFEAHLSKEKN